MLYKILNLFGVYNQVVKLTFVKNGDMLKIKLFAGVYYS